MPTEFQHKVYEMTRKVPKGRVTTYKIIAEKLKIKGYRAVGMALNKNPYSPKVPCHRVVGSKGNLCGFASGIRKKAKLLKNEGISINKGTIVGFEEVLFKQF